MSFTNSTESVIPYIGVRRATVAQLGVCVSNLTVTFDHADHPVTAIENFSAQAMPGEIVGVVGPSGSGKTTLLSVLGGMITADTGNIARGRATVDGIDVLALDRTAREQYRRDTIGIVFQGFNLMPGLTAAENVALPLLVSGTRPKTALRLADERLRELGLYERRDHRPTELSGGQKQRIAVARSLINDPAVLLADEPTANLDRHSCESVVALLSGLRNEGRTIVVSTHDERVAGALDRVLTLGPEAPAPATPIAPVQVPQGQTFISGSRRLPHRVA